MTRERPPNPTNEQPFSRGNTRQPEEAAPPSTSPPPGAPTPPAAVGRQQRGPGEPAARGADRLRRAGPRRRRHRPAVGHAMALADPAGHAAGAGRRARQPLAVRRAERRAAREPERRRPVRPVVPVRHEGCGFRRVAPRVQGAGHAQLDDPAGRLFPPRARVADADHQPHGRDHRAAGDRSRPSVEGFTHAAYNALAASNPTVPLPPAYPDQTLRMRVTFFYNEEPPAPIP